MSRSRPCASKPAARTMPRNGGRLLPWVPTARVSVTPFPTPDFAHGRTLEPGSGPARVCSRPRRVSAVGRGASRARLRRRRRRRRRRAARGRWRAPCPRARCSPGSPSATQRSAPVPSIHTCTRSRCSLPSAPARQRLVGDRASPPGGRAARWPIIERSTGRANSSKLTCDDTGLPGRPKIGTRRRTALHRCERQRLGRLDRHLRPLVAAAARAGDAFDRDLHEVVVAHRHRAAREQRVALVDRGVDRGEDLRLVVTDDPEIDRVRSRPRPRARGASDGSSRGSGPARARPMRRSRRPSRARPHGRAARRAPATHRGSRARRGARRRARCRR